MSSLLDVYKRFDMDVDKASGMYIYDKEGRKYLDFLSGISVNALGHRHSGVMDKARGAMDRYLHLSNFFRDENQEELARKIVERTYPGKVFFANSGSEAVECAIKSARKYFNGEKYEVISFKNSFHGRTMAAIAATGQAKFREGLGPMPPGFVHADFNFLASAQEKINHKTCAVLVEVIQGEGGVNVADMEFIRGLREICSEKGIFLIVDEIQTGLGRTGRFMAYEHYGIKPDITLMGKALGGGFPLSAVLLGEEIAGSMKAGDHGSTFGGNPVACAAGLAVLEKVDDDMLARIREFGDFFINSFKELKKEISLIKGVRGRGLMVGVEMGFDASNLVDYLFSRGIIANCAAGNVLRFLPPYIVSLSEIEKVVEETLRYLKEKI
ncbi:MAG: aspartate aminotransferase family protein [Elusimicrobiota bacterium]